MPLEGILNTRQDIFDMSPGDSGFTRPEAIFLNKELFPFINVLEEFVFRKEKGLYMPIQRYGSGIGEYSVKVPPNFRWKTFPQGHIDSLPLVVALDDDTSPDDYLLEEYGDEDDDDDLYLAHGNTYNPPSSNSLDSQIATSEVSSELLINVDPKKKPIIEVLRNLGQKALTEYFSMLFDFARLEAREYGVRLSSDQFRQRFIELKELEIDRIYALLLENNGSVLDGTDLLDTSEKEMIARIRSSPNPYKSRASK